MFRKLKKKIEKNSVEKKSQIFLFFSNCPTLIFDQKLFITFVS